MVKDIPLQILQQFSKWLRNMYSFVMCFILYISTLLPVDNKPFLPMTFLFHYFTNVAAPSLKFITAMFIFRTAAQLLM